MCQSERSLCCQDVQSFGNSLTKMSHLLAGDPRTVRGLLVCVSLTGLCCYIIVVFVALLALMHVQACNN